ncbi:MAG: YbhB/YbcL family Raf kinase inhibitor-like protein [Candidatus Saccharimonadales bacterium]
MQLHSPVFNHGERMDSRFTCQGDNISPPLEIVDVPEKAQSLVLICDDPDAATDPNGPGDIFDHWVLFNISPKINSIAENSTPPSATQGINSKHELGWVGPCPPTGEHRYFFRLYALDSKLDLEEGADKEEVESALAGHVLVHTELVGTYEKN